MAGQDQAESIVDTTKSLKRKNLSDEDQDCLNELDRAFKRIKAVVPPVPYILSAPSLHPYRYHTQQEANAWMMGRLWRHNEEHLQYRTYMYREPCQDCLELQAGEDEPEPERPGSRASNIGDPPKKKLNLSAFKVKQVNGTNTPNSKKPSPNLPPTKPVHEQVNGIKKLEKSLPSKSEADPKSSSKAYVHTVPEDMALTNSRSLAEPRDSGKPAKPNHEDVRTAVKPQAAKQSQKQEPAETKNLVDKSSQSNTTPHGLPPLLSPVHEPPSNPYGLPDILSPTLPSNIQAELDRLEVQRKRAESNASTSSSDRKSQAPPVPSTKPAEPAKSDTRIRSVSTNGQAPVLTKPRSTGAGNPSLIVKLKFSKAKIPIVRQILKLPPKRTPVEKKDRQEPTKEAPVSLQAKEEELKKQKPVPKIAARRSENTTPVPSSAAKPAAPPTATKVAEKRPRADDDSASAVPAKRARAASTLDRPVTPMQHGTASPALSNKSSAQKSQSQYLTPKNTQKATSMLRTQSTESNDSTPGQPAPTPTGVKAEAKSGPTSAPTNKKQVDITLLAQASMKLNQMGRALKHEATKILTGTGKQITKQDEKLAAVTNMECILSYMAAYHAQDLSVVHRGRAPEVESTWKTLLPLCLSYARTTKEFKHLDGLRSYLSSVIASTICSHVSQRISTSQPHDSPQDVSRADLAKQHAALTANFALLSDHNMKANQHFQKARVALPFEDIQTMYKKTYAAREANAKLAKEPEKIAGARMAGPYFLPLAHDTTAIQAARFGLRFLAEYCEKEKLDYTFRVKLDKAE